MLTKSQPQFRKKLRKLRFRLKSDFLIKKRVFKQLAAQHANNILLNCLVTLLVQTTLNDIGNNRGGVVTKVHTQIGGSQGSVCLRTRGGESKFLRFLGMYYVDGPHGHSSPLVK